DFGAQPLDTFRARGGERDREFSDLVLHRIEIARVAHTFFEQPIARTERALERRDARAVAGVDREHQTIEKAAALSSGTEKEPIHFGNEPNDAKVLRESGSGRHILALDS